MKGSMMPDIDYIIKMEGIDKIFPGVKALSDVERKALADSIMSYTK